MLPSDDVVVSAQGLSKRFCRDLKTSLIYAVRNVGREFVGAPSRPGLGSGEFYALNDVSFTLRRGESLGLVGPNGAGKTTLLRILGGIIKPDAGRVRLRGRVAPLIALGAGFNPVLTGRENIWVNTTMLGISGRQIDRRFSEIVEFADIGDALDAPVRTYSSGTAARLGFACAIHTDPDILLIDEVLAVGDQQFRAKCYRRLAQLRRGGTALILVSHNPIAVLSACDAALYLSAGRAVLKGSADDVLRRYEEDANPVDEPRAEAELLIPRRESIAPVRIRSIGFKDPAGRALSCLTSGEPAELWVGCEADEPVGELCANLFVQDLSFNGGRALYFNSVRDGHAISVGRGPFTVRVRFPYCGMRSGRYALKFQLTDGRYYHMYDGVESFLFGVRSQTDMAQCRFYQPHNWEIS
ncbi:MAG: ABC transporter ATP-binding protein [Elusimicrobia bacterium]|nr:ABC transporter ATP-binding protein [Elusimicrobiota bacterium]